MALALPGYACDNHGAGYGMRYGHQSFSPLRASAATLGARAAYIKLSAPLTVRTSANQNTEIAFQYSVVGAQADAPVELSLNFDPAEVLSSAEPVVVNQASGSHTFVVLAKQAGTYRLELSARSLQASEELVRRKTVYIAVQ